MTTALDRFAPVATPGRIGQGTAVEQSRAVAQVQAQVIVAQQMPRDIGRAVREMQRSCAMKSLAEKAFYRYKRGGQQISGPSVQLARELARAFGNVEYGISELRRDDAHGQSEMLAFAWDLETNARTTTTFIVQHIRDTKDGSKVLTDQRDIYETNANNGARRLREMIFAILPGWYTEDAVAACHKTLADDDSDGATVAERAQVAVTRFGKIGVTGAQLEQKLGAPQARWAPSDLAQLAVIWRSIDRAETTTEAEFGAAPSMVSPADLAPKSPSPAGTDAPPSSAPSPVTPQADVPPAGEATSRRRPLAATEGQVTTLRMHVERLGYEGNREGRLKATAQLANVPGPLATSNDLTREQAALAIRRVKDLREPVDLAALLDDLADDSQDAAQRAGDGQEDGHVG